MIKWLDSVSPPGGWQNKTCLEDFKEPEMVISVGFVFEDSEELILIVPHYGTDQIDGAMGIPKCAIEELTELNPTTKGIDYENTRTHHIAG